MPKNFHRLLVEETPDALIATLPDGEILHWSKGAEKTFGDSKKEPIGQPIYDLIVPTESIK